MSYFRLQFEKKEKKNINQKFLNTRNSEIMYYQNGLYVKVKNQNLLKIKTQKEY